MPDDLLIRDFQSADLVAVQLLNERARNPNAELRESETLRDIPGRFQRRGAFLVGHRSDELAVMGSLEPIEPGVFEVDYVRVAFHLHRLGFGRSLMAALEERARLLGAHTLVLNTEVSNSAARALYASIGYEDIGRRSVWNEHGVEFPIVDFRKRLI